jgi:hypothetical protein
MFAKKEKLENKLRHALGDFENIKNRLIVRLHRIREECQSVGYIGIFIGLVRFIIADATKSKEQIRNGWKKDLPFVYLKRAEKFLQSSLYQLDKIQKSEDVCRLHKNRGSVSRRSNDIIRRTNTLVEHLGFIIQTTKAIQKIHPKIPERVSEEVEDVSKFLPIGYTTHNLQDAMLLGPIQEPVPPGPIQEPVSPGIIQEHSPPNPLQEHSPPGPLQEHSSPGPLQEHSSPGPLQEHSSSGPLQERTPSGYIRDRVAPSNIDYIRYLQGLDRHENIQSLQSFEREQNLRKHKLYTEKQLEINENYFEEYSRLWKQQCSC